MAGVAAIQGVDNTLVNLTNDALGPLNPTVDVTVGPLDREDDRLRLNWFLYRVEPNVAYRNMEPPRTGWRTAYGCPPLALQLHYLLSAHPAALTQNGEEDQFAHRALGAAMAALHDHRVIADGDPFLSALAAPLVEPLRVTMASLDLEALTKLWTAATSPVRLSLGYEVSLVVIDTELEHVAGPPVRTRRVFVDPSMGPRLGGRAPLRIGAGVPFRVPVTGVGPNTTFALARGDDDPAGPADGWAITVGAGAPGEVELELPPARADLGPGSRQLVAATEVEAGIPFGRDQLEVVLVPTLTAPAGSVARGAVLGLATAHSATDVEVFLNGVRVPPAVVQAVSPTHVDVTVPASTATGPGTVSLRAGKVAGPESAVTIT